MYVLDSVTEFQYYKYKYLRESDICFFWCMLHVLIINITLTIIYEFIIISRLRGHNFPNMFSMLDLVNL